MLFIKGSDWTNRRFDLMVALDEKPGDHFAVHPEGEMNVWYFLICICLVDVEIFYRISPG